MVRHLIASKLIDSSAENKEKVKEVLMSMKEKIEELVDIEVGIDFLCGERSYDVVLIITVKDRAALDAYIEHPYHQSVIIPFMNSVRVSSVAVDWENI